MRCIEYNFIIDLYLDNKLLVLLKSVVKTGYYIYAMTAWVMGWLLLGPCGDDLFIIICDVIVSGFLMYSGKN